MTEDYWKGVSAYERHEECPEGASTGFQRGYGEAYAAAEAKPPIDLRRVNEEFNRVFKETA